MTLQIDESAYDKRVIFILQTMVEFEISIQSLRMVLPAGVNDNALMTSQDYRDQNELDTIQEMVAMLVKDKADTMVDQMTFAMDPSQLESLKARVEEELLYRDEMTRRIQ